MNDAIWWIAQVIGVFGVAACMLCFHGKNMKWVVRGKLIADILWAIHYFMLGATTGGITNVVCLCRELVYMNKDKKPFGSKWWLVFFLVLNWGLCIWKWSGIYSILPAIATTFATYSFWQNSVKRTRCIALVNNALMFSYDIFVNSYSGLVCESLTAISVIDALIRGRKQENA